MCSTHHYEVAGQFVRETPRPQLQAIKCFQENRLPPLTDCTSRERRRTCPGHASCRPIPCELSAPRAPTAPMQEETESPRRECRVRPSLLLRQSVKHSWSSPSTADPTMDYSCVKKTKNVHCSIHIHKCNALQLKAGTFTFCGTCYCIHTYTNQESKPPSASCKVTEEEQEDEESRSNKPRGRRTRMRPRPSGWVSWRTDGTCSKSAHLSGLVPKVGTFSKKRSTVQECAIVTTSVNDFIFV